MSEQWSLFPGLDIRATRALLRRLRRLYPYSYVFESGGDSVEVQARKKAAKRTKRGRRERYVMAQRESGKSYREIGEALHVSVERVRVIYNEAMKHQSCDSER